jgi:hypothetical protein
MPTDEINNLWESSLFSSDESAQWALRPIAEALFDEMIIFGRLLCERAYEWSTVERYLKIDRKGSGPLQGLLEHTSNLRFTKSGEGRDGVTPRRIPFIYNRGNWDNDLPLAGYSDMENVPLPHQVVVSIIGNWRLGAADRGVGLDDAEDDQEEDSDEDHSWPSPLLGRILLATLWMCSKNDLAAAVDFVLDLQLHGYIPDPEVTVDTIIMLMEGRCIAGSDQEMIRRFLCGSIPVTNQGWLESNITFSWLRPEAPVTDECHVVPLLLSRGFSAVEKVRAARSLDEWILGCAEIRPFIRVIRLVVSHLQQIPITARSAMALFDEISADALSLGVLVLHADVWAGYAQTIGTIFKNEFGDRWKDALYNERLIVPSALRTLLLDLEGEAPEEWVFPSWRIAHPFSTLRPLFISQLYISEWPFCTRAKPLDVDTILADQRIASFFEAHNILNWTERRLIVSTELGDDSGVGIATAYPREETRKLIAFVHAQLSLQEIVDLYESKTYRKMGIDTKRRKLDRMLRVHPHCYAIWWEMAVACDKRGDSASALEYILPAIVLEPDNDDVWQSLEVILRRLGHDVEADLASFIRSYWRAALESAEDA